MNKTVRDVVIEFKGEACDVCFIEAIGIAPDIMPPRYIGQIVGGGLGFDEEYYRLVCTKSQFNTYVGSLSHHVGKELFQQYLAADKTLLEKETKVDYTSEEFWEDELYSPYLCVIIDNKTGFKIWKRSLPAIDSEFYRFYGGSEFYDGSESYAISRHAFIPRPQPKPVFTQEMYERNELPPIGSEYLDEDGQLCKALLHYSSFVVGEMLEHISIQQYPVLSTSRNDRVEMITPPIELIDGECYQFDCEVGTRNGVYSFSDNRFIGLMLKVQTNVCTNIKPLTVDKS